MIFSGSTSVISIIVLLSFALITCLRSHNSILITICIGFYILAISVCKISQSGHGLHESNFNVTLFSVVDLMSVLHVNTYLDLVN